MTLLEEGALDGDIDSEVLVRIEDFDQYLKLGYIPWKRHGEKTIVLLLEINDFTLNFLKKKYPLGIHPYVISVPDFYNILQKNFGPELLLRSKNSLKKKFPEYSSYKLLNYKNWAYISFVGILSCYGILFNFSFYFNALFFAINVGLLFSNAFKVYLYKKGLKKRALKNNSTWPRSFPVYSILLPMYDEDYTVSNLFDAIKNLNYPKESLDVIVLIEEFDQVTLKFITEYMESHNDSAFFKIIKVPAGGPKTKPNACAYGMQFVRGEYVTVFDAEDRPDPNQLIKALNCFNSNDENLVCVQAMLAYYNRNEGILPKLFSIEYGLLFKFSLQGMSNIGAPFPLGGSSNHFKVDKLKEIGGWDPYNVTEDADIGYRLAKFGYESQVIDSVTFEESPIHVSAWVYQRVRWIKGHIQTYVVHLRTIDRLKRYAKLKGLLSFYGFLILPIFANLSLAMGLLIAMCGFFDVVSEDDPLEVLLVIMNLVAWIGSSWFYSFKLVKQQKWKNMWIAVILFIPYYALHNMAAVLAIWQLMVAPHYWNKTKHSYYSRKQQLRKVLKFRAMSS